MRVDGSATVPVTVTSRVRPATKVALLATLWWTVCGLAAAPAAEPLIGAGAETHWDWAGWGGGGFFWGCAWHPTDPQLLYLGGDVAGVYRSTDQGATWQFANRGLHNYAVYSLTAAPSSPGVVYGMTLDGMCRSDDAGQSWHVLEATRNGKLGISAHRPGSVRAIAVHPLDADTVYAGSRNGGLFRSTDGGVTWQKLDYLAPLRAETGPALPPPAADTGFAVLSFASDVPDPARNGRVEKFLGPTGKDWSAYARLTAQLRIPPGAPPLEAQLVVQTGDAWLWQAGRYVPLAPDTWTEVALGFVDLKDLQAVRIAYVLVRSPKAAYKGEVYLDSLLLHPAAGEPVVVSGWDKAGELDDWRANRKYADALYVTGLRHSATPAVEEKGVISAVVVDKTGLRVPRGTQARAAPARSEGEAPAGGRAFSSQPVPASRPLRPAPQACRDPRPWPARPQRTSCHERRTRL